MGIASGSFLRSAPFRQFNPYLPVRASRRRDNNAMILMERRKRTQTATGGCRHALFPRRMRSSFLLGILLSAAAASACQHPSAAPSPSETARTSFRLAHPEQLVIPPRKAEWPRPVPNGEFPQYPPHARDNGVEARVITAFVIDESGRPEYPTISILQPSPSPDFVDFASSVCKYLRTDARFSFASHPPARALVVMPFEFTLSGVIVRLPLPPKPDLDAVSDTLRRLSASELTAWIDSKQHCG